MDKPQVHAFFHHDTWTVTYVVFDTESRDAIVIDPVLDFDALSSQTATDAADDLIAYVESQALTVRAVLETHAHADHISAARYLADRWKAPIGVGREITQVQTTFARVFGIAGRVDVDGSQFDLLLTGGESYEFGSLTLRALNTPGHTPACLSFLIGDAVFTGDALFMEDYGTGRTDFPAGSAEALYRSVHEVLYSLPGETRVFVGHDYQPGGRDVAWESTISRQKKANVQLCADTKKDAFVAFRKDRDAGLRPPRLIFPSIQVNVFGGRLPVEEENGIRYLRVPLNMRCPTDDTGHPKSEDCVSRPEAAE